MNFLVLTVVLTLLVIVIPGAENSHIQFRSNPSAIYPILTTTFQLRCSLQSNQLMKDASMDEVSFNPFLKFASFNDSNDTTPYQFVNSGPTATPVTTPPALNLISADVAHVTSIIIIKLTENGQREGVASVSLFDAASYDGNYASQAKVEGSCERSPVVGEQGFLTVTWNRPLLDLSGQYICEISGLDNEKQPVTLQSNLQITSSQPTLADLIGYISDNAMKISLLETENSQVKNEIFNLSSSIANRTSLNNLKAQNIQTGSGECLYNIEHKVFFSPTYRSAPKIFLSITNLTNEGQSSYNRAEGSVHPESVSAYSFWIRCQTNSYTTLAYSWMAIDN